LRAWWPLLGGPADVLHDAGCRARRCSATCRRRAPACCRPATCAPLGLAVVALGGGRRTPGAPIDPRVGLSHIVPLGASVAAGEVLARVHAASGEAAAAAVAAVQSAFTIGDAAVAAAPLIAGRIGG
jgi:thymidine phosphorylase